MTPAQMFSVEGYGAVVTGGASGIGLAISHVLAENGAHVTIMDKDLQSLEVAAEWFEALGLTVHTAVVDVSDPQGMREAFAAANQVAGRLDVVFANAGIGAGAGFMNGEGEILAGQQIEDYDLATWDRTLDVNLKGALITIQEAARHMKARRSGRIVVTSSVTAVTTPTTFGFPYPVSKAAVAHLVRCVAVELVQYGILVNAIAPGAFATPISGGRLMDPQVEAKMGPGIPIGRFARTDEIKGLALFLASSASSYVVGSQILCDGGLSLGRIPRPSLV